MTFIYSLKLGASRPFQLAPAPRCQGCSRPGRGANIQELVQAVNLIYADNIGFANIALEQLPGAPEGPDTQVWPASCPLMSVDIQKLVQAVTLTYVNNIGLAKYAL